MSLLTSRTDDLRLITSLSDTPIYNIKVVVQKTRIQTTTLRAWERRYGIPQPGRSDHGHRLYSPRDLAILTWLRQRVDEGIAISHAVAMLQQEIPVVSNCDATPACRSVVPDRLQEVHELHRLAQALLLACTQFDVARAHRLVNRACALYSVEKVVTELFCPVVSALGSRWADGTGTVVEEHFGSNFVRQRLLGMFQIFPIQVGLRVVCACPAYEDHELGLMMFALLLQERGWEVFYLGQRTDLASLAACIDRCQPDAICVTASTPGNVAGLVEMSQYVQKLTPQPIFAYGGGAFLTGLPTADALLGSYLGTRIDGGVELLAQLAAASRGLGVRG